MKLNKFTARSEIFRSKFLKRCILIAGILGFSILPCLVLDVNPGSGPKPGLKGIDDHGRMQISSQDRCPVCAMKVSAHSKFACAIQLMDQRTFYFCGTGCMIRSWMHPEIFLKASKRELKRSVVQDYFTGEQVDGLSVVWVAGSDVVGPMGPAMVPLKDEQSLSAFKKRHGGKVIFRLQDMNDQKWLTLTGKKAAPEK